MATIVYIIYYSAVNGEGGHSVCVARDVHNKEKESSLTHTPAQSLYPLPRFPSFNIIL